MTCGGCGRAMKKVRGAGLWIDALGRFRGTYALCRRCADVVRHGSRGERDEMAWKAEQNLILAGRCPSAEVN